MRISTFTIIIGGRLWKAFWYLNLYICGRKDEAFMAIINKRGFSSLCYNWLLPRWPHYSAPELGNSLYICEFSPFSNQLWIICEMTKIPFQISETEIIDIDTHGFTKDGIPDVENVTRIDIVGGVAIQKVSTNRSYFR